MSAGERIDPKSGPFGNLSEAYGKNLDVAARGFEPILRGLGRWNLEILGLGTRRARAWAELPARLAQCRTPQDLVREQLQFWQTATHDYVGASQRLSVAFGAMAVPGLNGAHSAKEPDRDYITFPEPKPAAEQQPVRSRRAA